MPATSQAMQEASAIALKQPDKLYARNRGLLKMASGDLRDFAATPRTGLPKYAPKKKFRYKAAGE